MALRANRLQPVMANLQASTSKRASAQFLSLCLLLTLSHHALRCRFQYRGRFNRFQRAADNYDRLVIKK